FLPDGRHFTYVVWPPSGPNSYEVRVGSLDGGPGWRLMSAEHAPRCDGRRWLVFMHDRELMAQRVERSGRRLIGLPIPVPEPRERMGGADDPIVMVAPGVLVYAPEDVRPTVAAWYTRQGLRESVLGELGPHIGYPSICPDGRRAIALGVQ